MYISHFNYVNNGKYIDSAVGISAYPARYLIKKVDYISELAPDRSELKKLREDENYFAQYSDNYINKLERINFSIFKELEDKILCCHCKDVIECHRFLLSCFYAEKTGLYIPALELDLYKLIDNLKINEVSESEVH